MQLSWFWYVHCHHAVQGCVSNARLQPQLTSLLADKQGLIMFIGHVHLLTLYVLGNQQGGQQTTSTSNARHVYKTIVHGVHTMKQHDSRSRVLLLAVWFCCEVTHAQWRLDILRTASQCLGYKPSGKLCFGEGEWNSV